jgi:uncharacterized C2H2 Zn-finger protein
LLKKLKSPSNEEGPSKQIKQEQIRNVKRPKVVSTEKSSSLPPPPILYPSSNKFITPPPPPPPPPQLIPMTNGKKLQLQQQQQLILPKPPTLFKVTQFLPQQQQQNHHQTIQMPNLILGASSSANSSILSRASGMSTQFIPQPPKLSSIDPKLSPNSTLKNAQSKNLTLMPKLDPIAKWSKEMNSQQDHFLSPRPPPLIKPTEMIFSPNSSPTSKEKKKQSHLPPPPQLSPNYKKQSQTTNDFSGSKVLQLKCKFCSEFFEQQEDFLQHVIESHPKMLKQRLNRTNNQTTSNSNSNNNGVDDSSMTMMDFNYINGNSNTTNNGSNYML